MILDAPDFFPKREKRFPPRRIRNILCKRSEAIYTGALDCFTLRVRNDVRDNLNKRPK
jgi:hypothetical protein